MSFKMVSLTRCKKSGAYVARKGVPADIRAAHEKLYGSRWETKLYVSGNVSVAEAKRRFAEWQAEVSARIAVLRRDADGDGRTLTHREAHALAGDWYAWFVGQFEDDPGAWHDWDHQLEELANARLRYAPDVDRLPPGLADEVIDADPKVQAFLRQVVADRALASRFLAERACVLTSEARERFLAALIPEFVAALNLLRRRADGDYSKDNREARFPKHQRAAGMTCWQLFEAWIAERKPKPATVDRRRAVFLDLQERFGDRDIATIADQDAVKWKDSLLTPDRSGRTVNDVWLVTAKGVFKWAVTNKKIANNPFQGLRVSYAAPAQNRDSRAFTEEEAQTILRASLGPQPRRLSSHYHAARRWVPWLCGYTGALVQEITQLRAEDVIEQDGIWALRLLPSAGTVKTGKARTAPLHPHLIEQGFLGFAQGVGKGPLFYCARSQAAQGKSDPTNPQKALAVKTREHLAAWVRKIGVNDPELSPNHSWRHLFKEIADRCEMREKVSDAITGHAQATVGRTYGRPTLLIMAQEIAKFPRFVQRHR